MEETDKVLVAADVEGAGVGVVVAEALEALVDEIQRPALAVVDCVVLKGASMLVAICVVTEGEKRR